MLIQKKSYSKNSTNNNKIKDMNHLHHDSINSGTDEDVILF